MTTKTDDKERVAFEAWVHTREGHPFARVYLNLMWAAWQARAAVEADRQSQPAISDMQLHCILQVYDDALDKAREGREFDNPGRPGSLEARAWDAGTRRGKELGPITQPAASEEPSESAVLLDALSGLVKALRERHYGRMPDEVQAAYDKAWAIVFSSPVAAPVAQEPVTELSVDWAQQFQAALENTLADAIRYGGGVISGAQYGKTKSALCAFIATILDVAKHANNRNAPVAQAPVGEVFTMEPLDGSGDVKSHALLTKDLPAGTKLYVAPVAVRAAKGADHG